VLEWVESRALHLGRVVKKYKQIATDLPSARMLRGVNVDALLFVGGELPLEAIFQVRHA
jgi:hypothetical protein